MSKKMKCPLRLTAWIVSTRSAPLLVLAISGLLMVAAQASASASGTVVEIRTVEALQRIGRHSAYPLSGAYRLADDINARETREWDEGRGFQPIGGAAAPFTGVFDGGGHVITGLTIYRPDKEGVGLFGHVGGEARIANVTLETCTVRGGNYTGGLVGEHFGKMENCHVRGMVRGQDHVGVLTGANRGAIQASTASGAVAGREYVGGLVGVNHDPAVMDQCGAEVSVRGHEVVGGLAGANLHGRLTSSHATGRVAAARYVGGLTGINLGFIAGSRSTGDVDASAFAGGLIGVHFGKAVFNSAAGLVRGDETVGGLTGFAGDGFILHCHAMGAVTGGNRVGGLIGVLSDAGAVRASRAEGNVTGNEHVGGLIGETNVNSTSLLRSYWGDFDEEDRGGLVMGSTVTECHATGDVAGEVCVGGLIGSNICNIVTHCYATGAVSGREKIGGLVGLNITPFVLFPAIIRRCYAVGRVSGDSETGGLVGGDDRGRVVSSFWDVHATMQESSAGGGVGIDVVAMHPADVLQAHGWDYENTWRADVAAGFPLLRVFQKSAPATWDAYLYETIRTGRKVSVGLDDVDATDRQSSWMQQLAIQLAEMNEDQAQQEEMARMEALGYMIAGGSTPEATGVVLHEPGHAWQGLNLYVSEHAPEVVLMDMDGRQIHRWRRSAEEIWPDDGRDAEGDFWSRAHVFDNGDLLVIRLSRQLVKFDKDSNVLWYADIWAHHDFDIAPSGDIYVLIADENTHTATGEPRRILEDFVVVLDKDGKEKQRVSLLDCFENSTAYRYMWDERHVKHGDIFHANALRVLDGGIAELAPEFQAGRVLVSLRELDAVAVIDLDLAEVVWAKRGPWRGQHDPRVLDHGALLLFDNYGRPDRSTVYEFDIPTMKELWRYQGSEAAPFLSETNGRSHRLPNGNTLIIESDTLRAFEVTPGKRIVWEFINPHTISENNNAPALLFDVTRLAPDMPLHWAETPPVYDPDT